MYILKTLFVTVISFFIVFHVFAIFFVFAASFFYLYNLFCPYSRAFVSVPLAFIFTILREQSKGFAALMSIFILFTEALNPISARVLHIFSACALSVSYFKVTVFDLRLSFTLLTTVNFIHSGFYFFFAACFFCRCFNFSVL